MRGFYYIMDTISNMLTKIRNASSSRHYKVDIPYTNFKLQILKILKSEGFIRNIKVMQGNSSHSYLRVFLKYVMRNNISIPIPVINSIQLGSKQSRPVYVKAKNINKRLNGLAVTILSTSKGIMTETRAKLNNVGGKVICYIL